MQRDDGRLASEILPADSALACWRVRRGGAARKCRLWPESCSP